MSRWAERWAALSSHSDTVDTVDTVGRPPAGSPPEVHSVTQCQSVMAPDADTETRRNPGVLGSALHSVHSVNSVTYIGQKKRVGASTVSKTILTLHDTVETQPLAASPDTSSVTIGDTVDSVDSVEADEERAAIIEYEGGIPRAWASGIGALMAMPRPDGFMPERWNRIIKNTQQFVTCWAEVAIGADWTTLDVFGLHPDRPDARFDAMGLILLLDRFDVIALDNEGADLASKTGARLRYRRRPLPAATVPLWALRKGAQVDQ